MLLEYFLFVISEKVLLVVALPLSVRVGLCLAIFGSRLMFFQKKVYTRRYWIEFNKGVEKYY